MKEIIVDVTNACCMSCKLCGTDSVVGGKKHLQKEIIRQILEYSSGEKVFLGGGCFFCHPEWKEMVDSFPKYKTDITIDVPLHPYILHCINEKPMDEHNYKISVSLWGGERIHNQLSSGFDLLDDFLDVMERYQGNKYISFVLTKQLVDNPDDIKPILERNIENIYFHRLMPTGRCTIEDLPDYKSLICFKKLIDDKYKAQFHHTLIHDGCTAYRDRIFIDWNADVYGCGWVGKNKPIGNLSTGSFDKIISDSKKHIGTYICPVPSARPRTENMARLTRSNTHRTERGRKEVHKMKKPHIFIASSAEALSIASEMQGLLEHDAECTVWNQGVFGSPFPIMDLMNQSKQSDFGIFVFSYDDAVIKRDDKTWSVRDNVIFELGMFVGSLGVERCFIVEPNMPDKKTTLPSDLAGIKPLRYIPNREDGNVAAALGPAATAIKKRIQKWKTGDKKQISETLAEQIANAGINAFYTKREDYKTYRMDASSIDKYLERATKSIIITGIALSSGIQDDDICRVIKQQIEENDSFHVVISLLNPRKKELFESLDSSPGLDPKTLQERTYAALRKLISVKETIEEGKRDNLVIKVHNILPYASSIILDGDDDGGTIQLEVKPYKQGTNQSFAIEIKNDKNNEFYHKLVESFMDLIQDAEEWKE